MGSQHHLNVRHACGQCLEYAGGRITGPGNATFWQKQSAKKAAI
jgi:hypothetical protein